MNSRWYFFLFRLISLWRFYVVGFCVAGLWSCGDASSDTLFVRLSANSTRLDFVNEVQETEQFNILDYMYLYNGGGVAVGDLNNDGLPDLYFTANQQANKLYLNRSTPGKGDIQFEDITKKAGVGGEVGANKWKTGVTLVDINADGWLDIYVCEVDSILTFKGANKLYINNKDGTFTDKAAEYGLNLSSYAQQAAFFDYDLDGDLDMYLVNQSVHSPASYQRTEGRTQLDLKAGDYLLRNDGGRFVDVSQQAGIYQSAMGYGLAVSVADLNNDRYPDIYVSNDFHENDYLYYNNGDGTFRENIVGSAGHVSTFSMGTDIADLNNDGMLDIFSLDMKPGDETILKQSSGVDSYNTYQYKLDFGFHYQYSRNMLQLNEGHLFGKNEVQFSEIGQLAGVSATDWSWGCLLADFDNDGHKDIFISNGIPRRPNNLDYIKFLSDHELRLRQSGQKDSLTRLAKIERMPSGETTNVAYRNLGTLQFEDVSAQWGLDAMGVSNGCAYADLDGDGDLDLVVNNLNEKAALFKNLAVEKKKGNYLKVHLVGNALNLNGLGARVEVEAGGKTQWLEKTASRGWLSSVQDDLLFGFGATADVTSLTVRWPDGRVQTLHKPRVNGVVTVRYADGSAVPVATIPPAPTNFNNLTPQSGISEAHQENNFVDFAIEPLMMRLLSKEGPKLAVGDVNGDGLDDVFLGGGKGQAGGLYVQQKFGSTIFRTMQQPAFVKTIGYEDIGSVFADVDGDKDLDLYVVSGGSEPDNPAAQQDRLYLNNGSGLFSAAPNRLPAEQSNGSCVTAGDFNQDGYVDFFVGGRSVAHEYGLPGASRLWLNNGKGVFQDATLLLGNAFGRIGMVTDAQWIAAEKKLVVVGEWMPITVFYFGGKSVVKQELPNTKGLWNTLHLADLNGDGRIDFLAGNLGINSDLLASPTRPLRLTVSDIDGNLSFDPILSYYKGSNEWVFAGLDDLAAQVPTVRRNYSTYKAYSLDKAQQVLPANLLKDGYKQQAETLASVVVYNNGNGRYVVEPLPMQAQVAPIYGFATGDFNHDAVPDVLAVGNFDGFSPAIGRMDASYGLFLKGNAQKTLEYVPAHQSGFAVFGECRDIKRLSSPRGPLMLVSRNNATPRLFGTQSLPATAAQSASF